MSINPLAAYWHRVLIVNIAHFQKSKQSRVMHYQRITEMKYIDHEQLVKLTLTTDAVCGNGVLL